MKQILLLSIVLTTFLPAFAQPNLWTWMSGDLRSQQYGVYGTKGVASAANKPGSRENAVSWSDASGNLWLFGGRGYAQNKTGLLNDLWKYSIATGLWTWVGGDQTPDLPGVYGVKGVASAGNKPGGRFQALASTDAAGNLWLFGGYTFVTGGSGHLNDLWKYSIATNEWTWMSGDAQPGQPGVYGVRGIADAANKPAARSGAAGGMDAAGNLWLFGGTGCGDLWKYTLSTGQWTWVSGDSVALTRAVYGSRGIADAANKPGGRVYTTSWATPSGDFWVFGGQLYDGNSYRTMSDFWKYDQSSGLWTWVGGDTTAFARGVYGTKGVASANNRPGSRHFAVGLTEASGKLLLYGGTGALQNDSYHLSDLWEYSPSSGQWTWIGGSIGANAATIGTKGVPASTNDPGGRYSHTGWLDPSGYLWIFGGWAYSSQTLFAGTANDLWRYTLTPPTVLSIANGFTAKKESQKVTLNWTANKDQNIRSFVVERSSGSGAYDSIGTVAATTAPALTAHYSFIDKAPLPGTNFYRIKLINPAGAATYTAVAKVLMETNAIQFSVVRNPVRGKLQLNIQLPEAQKLTLEVRDMNGQLLLRQEEKGYPGAAVYEVGADRLAKGTYLIHLTAGNKTETKAFIKQ